MASYSDDLRADIEEAMSAAAQTTRIMKRVHERMGVVQSGDARRQSMYPTMQAPTEAEVFAAAFDEATDELHTSKRVKELAAKGLRAPYKLDEKEMQELCGSVMAHITQHGG